MNTDATKFKFIRDPASIFCVVAVIIVLSMNTWQEWLMFQYYKVSNGRTIQSINGDYVLHEEFVVIKYQGYGEAGIFSYKMGLDANNKWGQSPVSK